MVRITRKEEAEAHVINEGRWTMGRWVVLRYSFVLLISEIIA